VNARFFPILLALDLTTASYGVQSLEGDLRKNGDAVVSIFEDQRAVLQRSSAVIREGRKDLCYGVVISADGYILTKASEVQKISSLSVIVNETKYDNAKVVATDPTWDVALIIIIPSAFDTIRPACARFVQKIGGAIEDAELRVPQIGREPFGADDRFGMGIGGHGFLLIFQPQPAPAPTGAARR
jgi:hypothetical protein